MQEATEHEINPTEGMFPMTSVSNANANPKPTPSGDQTNAEHVQFEDAPPETTPTGSPTGFEDTTGHNTAENKRCEDRTSTLLSGSLPSIQDTNNLSTVELPDQEDLKNQSSAEISTNNQHIVRPRPKPRDKTKPRSKQSLYQQMVYGEDLEDIFPARNSAMIDTATALSSVTGSLLTTPENPALDVLPSTSVIKRSRKKTDDERALEEASAFIGIGKRRSKGRTRDS